MQECHNAEEKTEGSRVNEIAEGKEQEDQSDQSKNRKRICGSETITCGVLSLAGKTRYIREFDLHAVVWNMEFLSLREITVKKQV